MDKCLSVNFLGMIKYIIPLSLVFIGREANCDSLTCSASNTLASLDSVE